MISTKALIKSSKAVALGWRLGGWEAGRLGGGKAGRRAHDR